jgi:GAF domain-containing protein
MPSDNRLTATLALLSPTVEALRAAITSTTEEVRGYLALHAGSGRDPLDRGLATLTALSESVAQQLEQLRQLQALTAQPTAPESDGAILGAASAHRADKLAAWLLQQADLSDLS